MSRKITIFARASGICLLSALLAAFVIFTDAPSRRYLEYQAQCKMIFAREGRINLAAIGSSRSMRAFQAPVLEANVRNKYGHAPVILDLSRAYRDAGHMYVFIEDLLARHEVDMLLVEYKEAGEKGVHQLYGKTATFRQILESYHSYPSKPVLERIQQITSLLLDRGAQRFTELVRGELDKKCAEAKKNPGSATEDPSAPWYVDSILLKKQQQTQEPGWLKKQDHAFNIHAPEEERNTFYTRKVIELARAHGTEIFFYYIPELYARPFSEDFVREFSAAFGARLIQMSERELESIYPEGYTDGTHMGRKGARLYMDELADILPWTNYLERSGDA